MTINPVSSDEFRVIHETASEAQRKLNLLLKEYDMSVLPIGMDRERVALIVLLWRRKEFSNG